MENRKSGIYNMTAPGYWTNNQKTSSVYASKNVIQPVVWKRCRRCNVWTGSGSSQIDQRRLPF
jgi:hypothetical protein